MKRITRYIEQSLYRHECVVVPGLGAFIRHEESATLDPTKGLIFPGRSEISFNAALRTDDGILVDAYRRAFSLNYKRALSMIQGDVAELYHDLQTAHMLQLGSVGRLTMDKDTRQITFYPNPEHPFSTEHYGEMPTPQLPRLAEPASTPLAPERKQGVYYLPIHINTLKYGAAAVVIGVLTLLVPGHSLTTTTEKSYQAGFFADLERKMEYPPLPNAMVEAPVTAVNETSPKRLLAGCPLLEHTAGKVKYYVVIASLRNLELMEKYLKANPGYASFPQGGVLQGRSQQRLFAASFELMEEAAAYRKQLVAEHPELQSAWIYKAF